MKELTHIYILMLALLLSSTILLCYGSIYFMENRTIEALSSFLVGLTALIIFLSTLQRLRTISYLKIPVFKMLTTVECRKCGFKIIRAFKPNDYIMKQAEDCPKCHSSMFISSIYRGE